MRTPLRLAGLLLAPLVLHAWYEPGHRMVNQLALDSRLADQPDGAQYH